MIFPFIAYIKACCRLAKPLKAQWKAVKKNREKDLQWFFRQRADGSGVITLVRMEYNTELWRMQIPVSSPDQIKMEGKPYHKDKAAAEFLHRFIEEGEHRDDHGSPC